MITTKINFGVTQPPQSAVEQGSPSADGWHVVQVMTGKEQKVADELRDLGWHAYCPMETRWRKPSKHETPVRLSRAKDRRRTAISEAAAITHPETRERALAAVLRRFPQVGLSGMIEVRRAFFPGYLFVAVDRTRAIDSIKGSRHAPGVEFVTSVVCSASGGFARVPYGVVNALMAAETQGMLDSSRKAKDDITNMFAKGQPVRVIGGPFDSFVGSVLRCSPNKRVKIMLEAFGVVEVETEQVEATA